MSNLQLNLLRATLPLAGLLIASPAPAACSARSAARIPPVVELYTSEGCSSCPPADRWLSRIDAASPVVALAFHVDYWDRLGWTDRLAQAAFTRRQNERSRATGGRFVYTPQVRIDGQDAPQWSRTDPAGAAPRPTTASLDLRAAATANRVSATLAGQFGPAQKDALVWLGLTESGLSSEVRAGENAGALLLHDHVVRQWHGPFKAGASGDVAARVMLDIAGIDLLRARLVALAEQGTGGVVQAVSLPLSACKGE